MGQQHHLLNKVGDMIAWKQTKASNIVNHPPIPKLPTLQSAKSTEIIGVFPPVQRFLQLAGRRLQLSCRRYEYEWELPLGLPHSG
jgi:hypothetical protein